MPYTEFIHSVGSRAQVWHGTKHHTKYGLMKKGLTKNKWGRIVSRKVQKQSKATYKKNGLQPKTKAELAQIRPD